MRLIALFTMLVCYIAAAFSFISGFNGLGFLFLVAGLCLMALQTDEVP